MIVNLQVVLSPITQENWKDVLCLLPFHVPVVVTGPSWETKMQSASEPCVSTSASSYSKLFFMNACLLEGQLDSPSTSLVKFQ